MSLSLSQHVIGLYFDTRPCDISILDYILSGLLYPRVCGFGYLKNKPAPANPTGTKFIPLRNPRVYNLIYARNLMKQKPIEFRVSDTRWHPYAWIGISRDQLMRLYPAKQAISQRLHTECGRLRKHDDTGRYIRRVRWKREGSHIIKRLHAS